MNIPDKYIEYALDRIRTAAKERKENKRKKYNGYKDKSDRFCFYTGRPYAERHEVFYGSADREISIEYGFQVDLAPELHEEFHKNTEFGERESRRWRQTYETVYMDCLEGDGLTREEAAAIWQQLIGSNYLEEVILQ